MFDAFAYMFKDKNFILKCITYICVFVLASILFCFGSFIIGKNIFMGICVLILAIVISLSLGGYFISCIQSIMKDKDNINLPYINPLVDAGKGFKLLAGFLALGLCLLVYSILLAIPVVNIVAIVLYIPIVIFIFIFFPAFYYIFAKTGKVYSFVMFKTALNIIKENGKKYGITLLIMTGFIIATTIINFVAAKLTGVDSINASINSPGAFSKINIIGLIIYFSVQVIMSMYSIFVNAYLMANCSDAKVDNSEIPSY